jgi:hypothetical protein
MSSPLKVSRSPTVVLPTFHLRVTRRALTVQRAQSSVGAKEGDAGRVRWPRWASGSEG